MPIRLFHSPRTHSSPLLLFFSSVALSFPADTPSRTSPHASDDHQSKSPSPQSTSWKNRPAPMVVHSSLLHRLDALALYSYRLPMCKWEHEKASSCAVKTAGERLHPIQEEAVKHFKIASINCFTEMMALYFPLVQFGVENAIENTAHSPLSSPLRFFHRHTR